MTLSEKEENLLKTLYKQYNYIGVDKFIKILKKEGVTMKANDVREFIKSQSSNQVYNEPTKQPGHIVAFQPFDKVQMDILNMFDFKGSNKNNAYILLIIDIFTRHLTAYSIKNKSVESVKAALDQYFTKYHPTVIISDNEKSFSSKEIQKLFDKEEVISDMVPKGDHKALGIIDRVTRTIKEALYKYMDDNDTSHYIDELGRIIHSYNNTPNQGILDVAPDDADKSDNKIALQIYNHNKDKKNNKTEKMFKVGDYIRIRKNKSTFERAYDKKYGGVMKITQIIKNKATLNDGSTIDLRKIKAVPEQPTEQDQKVEAKAVEKVKQQARVERKVAREGVELNQDVEEARPKRNRTLSEKALQNLAQRK